LDFAQLRIDRLELLDQPSANPAELRANLRDIARLNRWFGGTSCVLDGVSALAGQGGARTLTVLDAGCGAADIPRAVVRWARRRKLDIRILAVDRHPEVLGAAAEWSRDYPEIRFLRADIASLPFGPSSFDIAVCSLTLHHLSPVQTGTLLPKLDQVSRLGFVITDLERSRVGYRAAWLATRLLSRNRLTRHDGPLSVLRAHTAAELRSLGVPCRRRAFFRLTATIAKSLDRPLAQ
jgi:SAM-dependent methyltransferase